MAHYLKERIVTVKISTQIPKMAALSIMLISTTTPKTLFQTTVKVTREVVMTMTITIPTMVTTTVTMMTTVTVTTKFQW